MHRRQIISGFKYVNCLLILLLPVFCLGQAAKPTPLPSPAFLPSPGPSPTPAKVPDTEEVISIKSTLVVVPVSVSDQSGKLVGNLQNTDFLLQEDGRTQEIEQLGDAGQSPLDIALLIDVSGSVDDRFSFIKQAAENFLKTICKPNDRITLYSIDSQPILLQPAGKLEDALQKLRLMEPSRATTAFYDTVAESVKTLKKENAPGRRRVVIVISDGEDTYSDNYHTAVAVIPELHRADALFYSINPSGSVINLNQLSRRGQDGMQLMASATGGTAFVPQEVEELNGIFLQIANELRSQYLLQYYSNDEETHGKFIKITVQIPKQPDLKVRARQGYYTSAGTN